MNKVLCRLGGRGVGVEEEETWSGCLVRVKHKEMGKEGAFTALLVCRECNYLSHSQNTAGKA